MRGGRKPLRKDKSCRYKRESKRPCSRNRTAARGFSPGRGLEQKSRRSREGRCRRVGVSAYRRCPGNPVSILVSPHLCEYDYTKRRHARAADGRCRLCRHAVVPLLRPPPAQDLKRRRNHRDNDYREDDEGEVFLDVGNVSKKMAQEYDAENPDKCSDDVVCKKMPVGHRTHARDERSEGPNQRNES